MTATVARMTTTTTVVPARSCSATSVRSTPSRRAISLQFIVEPVRAILDCAAEILERVRLGARHAQDE
jgi:hypothetical protein